MGLKRVRINFSYDGSAYAGFQVQPNKKTIQGTLEQALKTALNETIFVHASGRTDTGVHARKQVAHFDTTRNIDEKSIKKAINRVLPNDIYINDVTFVDSDWHARFHAKEKEYRYYLNLGEYDPLQSKYVYQYCKPLDIERMHEVIELFQGTHDFRSFCGSKKKINCIREVTQATMIQEGQQLIFIFKGNGFLRYMIRMFVGTLLRVGEGRLDREAVETMLESKGSIECIYKAKPQGLYLWDVAYEKISNND